MLIFIINVYLIISVGSVIPTGFAWSVAFMHAEILKTYGVPEAKFLFKSPQTRMAYFKQMMHIFKKTTANSYKVLGLNYSIQLVLCSFVLFMQQKQFIDVVQKMNFTQAEINKVIDSER